MRPAAVTAVVGRAIRDRSGVLAMNVRIFAVAGLVLLTGASLGWSGGAAAADAPITAVILYPGSATVQRTIQVPAGASRIEIPGLPAGFDSQTLHAEADPGIRIGQIVVHDAGRTEAANPAQADLEAKIQALRDQADAADAEAKSAEIVKTYLERFGGRGEGERPAAAIDAKMLSGLIEAIGRGAQDALDRIRRSAIHKRELDKKIQALERDLARLRGGDRDIRNLMVELSAERAGSLRVSYQVNGAGWLPSYRASLDSARSKVDLERLALISQKSGEDWRNVQLTLSTSQPRQSPQAPEPQPWLLSWQPPRPQPMMAAKSAMAAAPAPAAEARAMADSEPAYQPPMFELQTDFATEFHVPGRVTLPSDGREVSVALSQTVLPVQLRLRVAPRLERTATVIAEADRPSGVWLPGKMHLFRDGDYIGAGAWNPQAADRFMFSFGRDPLLRVAVDQVKGQSGSSGLFGKRKERRFAEVFTLTSAHRTPVALLVLESSPVSTAEEVVVERTFEPKPNQENWEQRRGVVAWETTLAPGASTRFSVDYRFEYPQEGWVPGLP